MGKQKERIKVICIGFLGSKRCYLNTTREEAIKRYKKDESWVDEDLIGLYVTEGYVTDSFWVYDIGLEEEENEKIK